MTKLTEGDIVTVKGNTYGHFKVKTLLPKGSHGRKCALAEVLHSSDMSFTFALVKVFRVVDLKRVL